MVRTHSGCTFATVAGKRSLVIVGGVSYYASKETTATTSTTVEYIAVDEIEEGKPKLLQPLILNHARKPSLTHIGTELFVIGGLRNNQELERSGGKFIEKWSGHSWKVLEFLEDDFYNQFDAHAVFLPKTFCDK